MAKKESKKAFSQKSLLRLAASLFEDESLRQEFVDSILQPSVKPAALIWFNPKTELGVPLLDSPSEFPEWISLVSAEFRLGNSEQHQRGDFYLLDPSSVMAMLSLVQLVKQQKLSATSVVVDLCASPGGKSIFASRAIRPSNLICNEVSGKRIPALLSNLKRCRIAEATVTQADPAFFSEHNKSVADLVLVDAPCSGQSLLAKAERGLGCFSKPVINANVGRQRRILAEASKIVREGGYILYSTCTFSLDENEKNIEWFLKKFPNFEQLETGRVWPKDNLGAGSYFSLLKHKSDVEEEQSGEDRVDLSQIRNWPIHLVEAE